MIDDDKCEACGGAIVDGHCESCRKFYPDDE